MELYKKLYFTLFGKVEDALVLMDDGKPDEAKGVLLSALDDAEDTYITANEEPTEEARLSEMMSQFLKTLHRLDKTDRPAAIRALKRQADGIARASSAKANAE